MKRRQYAIIIEEKQGSVNFQSVEEVENVEDAINLIRGNVEGYFWYEEDCLPDELIKVGNFKGLKEYLYFLNKEEYYPFIDIYCKALSKLYRIKHLRQVRTIVDQVRRVLQGVGSNVEIYLNSIKYEKAEPLGPCGLL